MLVNKTNIKREQLKEIVMEILVIMAQEISQV